MKKNDETKKHSDDIANKLENELDKISETYYRVEKREYLTSLYYATQNIYLNNMFKERLSKAIDEKKLEEIKKKLEDSPFNPDNEQILIKINNIISDLNEIKEENMKEYIFYDKLLVRLMIDYENKHKEVKDVEKTFNKVGVELVRERIQSLIKKEKKLLNLKEILNGIHF
jgi:hypothetical protein